MAPKRTERLWLVPKFLALLAIIASLLLPTAPAIALEGAPTDPHLIWDVGDAETEVGHTGRIRALVWDIEEYNGRIYVAGKFLNVYAPDGSRFPQPYMAAFDLITGEWIRSFAPRMRGPVYAIDITDDGTILAGGEILGGVQAINATSGADVPGFATNLAHSWGRPAVFDIEIVGDQTYLGGRFTRSGDLALKNLARVNTKTGTTDPTWRPTTELDTVTPIDGGTNVYGLAVDSSRDRVYLAGKFGSVNGDTRTFNFGIVNTVTGALKTDVPQGLPPGVLSHRESNSMWQHDVQFRDDRVYLGGQAHQTLILDAASLAPLRSYSTSRGVGDEYGGGDTQVLYIGPTTIWAGCHCWGSLAEYPIGSRNSANANGQQSFDEYQGFLNEVRTVPGSFSQQPVRAGYGIDIATGDKLPYEFNVNGQAGAWALLEDSNGRLWMGGQFTRDRSRNSVLRGLTRFSPQGRRPAAAPRPAAFRSTYHSSSNASCASTEPCRVVSRARPTGLTGPTTGTGAADNASKTAASGRLVRGWFGPSSFPRSSRGLR